MGLSFLSFSTTFPRLSYVLPAVLVAFGDDPLVTLIKRGLAQKADLEGRGRRIDSLRVAKPEAGNCSVGCLGSAVCCIRFLLGVGRLGRVDCFIRET